MMATLDSAAQAQAQSFLLFTPIGASPRGDYATDSKAAWAFAATSASQQPLPLTSFTAANMAPPELLTQRSFSTLSFGDNQDIMDAGGLNTPRLARFASEEYFGGFQNPATGALAWSSLQGIREASDEETRSPTNVDDGMSSAGAMMRDDKGNDILSSVPEGLFRQVSEDYGMLLRAKSDNLSGLSHLLLQREHSIGMMAVTEIPSARAPISASIVASAKNNKQEAGIKQEHSNARCQDQGDENDDTHQTAALLANVSRRSARNAGKRKASFVESDEETDDEWAPSWRSGKCSRKCSKRVKSDGSKQSNNNRGAHVRGRPEMQENARKGQEHWAKQVAEMRDQWEEVGCKENPDFKYQIELLQRRHIKSQHECLLRQLHMSATVGQIEPFPYNTAEGKSFVGWTGFRVAPDRASEFRGDIEGMFPPGPNGQILENTQHNMLRRAGLVPGSWGEAWLGLSPFIYKKPQTQK